VSESCELAQRENERVERCRNHAFFLGRFFSNHFFERVFSREEFFLEDMGLSPQNKSLLTKSDHAEHENIIVNMIFVQISDKNAILKSTNFSRLSGRLTVKKKEKT
jgi:hypothetical protein